jgi:hypothetical protein
MCITHPSWNVTHPKGGKFPSQPPTGNVIGGVTAGIAAAQKNPNQKKEETSLQNQGPNANSTSNFVPDFSCFISGFEDFCCCGCGCGCRRSDGDFSSPRPGFSKSNWSVSFLGASSSAGILCTFESSRSISSPLRVLSPSFSKLALPDYRMGKKKQKSMNQNPISNAPADDGNQKNRWIWIAHHAHIRIQSLLIGIRVGGDISIRRWLPRRGNLEPQEKKEKESQKRIQKIRKKETSSHCGKKLSLSIFAQQIPQDQINHTHKEAYTHHEINAKLFLPSSIRCQLTGEK